MSNQGWIKIHRRILDWEWYTKPNTCHLFNHLILKANHKNNNWCGIEIRRGQLITDLRTLAKDSGLTFQQVRTALKHLNSTQEITQTSTHRGSIIEIVNYSDYQVNECEINTDINTDINKQLTHHQHTTNTPSTHNKKEKNNKNENNDKNISLQDFKNWNWKEDKTFMQWLKTKNEGLAECKRELFNDSFVDNKKEAVILHCESKGVKYKNYKSALQNFINRDLGALNAK